MSTPEQRIPELLAPAVGSSALRAAVANGADAVYLGVDKLNARRGAENFTLESLAETCRFAHCTACDVYLTANVIVLPAEMRRGTRPDRFEAWAAGVDAVILQDLGLIRAVREHHCRTCESTLRPSSTPTARRRSSCLVPAVSRV